MSTEAIGFGKVESRVSIDSSTSLKLSSLTLCFNIILTMTGSAVLGVGAQMTVTGWVITPSLLCVGVLMTSELVWMFSATMDKMEVEGLLLASGRGEEISYLDFAKGSLGSVGWWASAVTTTFAYIGFINGGLLLESENLQIVVPLGGGVETGKRWWALILTSTTLLYCFVDIGKLLHGSGWSGIFLTFLSMVFVYWGTFGQAQDLQDFNANCFESGNKPYHSLGTNFSQSGFDGFMQFFQVTSYCIFIFAIVMTLPTLRGKMQRPEHLTRVSIVAFLVVAAEFIIIMLGYYWIFGNLGPQNVTNAMRTDRPAGWWAMASPWETGKPIWVGQALSICITFHLLCSDAIFVPCTVAQVESLFPSELVKKKRVWVTVRLLIAFERLLVASVVKDFVKLTNLTSAAFVTINNVLLPIVAFYRTGAHEHKRTGWWRQALHALLFVFGVFNMVFGSISAIQGIVNDSTQAPDVTHFPREGITEACKAAYHIVNPSGLFV